MAVQELFSKARIESWKKLCARYPQKRAALLPMLHDVQEDLGSVTPEAMEWLAHFLDLSPAQVEGVVTFYWMYDLEPRAKYRLAVCRNIACDILGKDHILQCIERKLGIKPGAHTKDHLFSVREVECMGACTAAPMLDLNETYHENLTPEKVEKLIDALLAAEKKGEKKA